MTRKNFYLFFLFLSATLFAQNQYPTDYFRAPLDIPLLLSGSFGELRNNHFHTGLDFKTQQKEGFKVYAAADGYISRIKISSYGYGKAIYIDHPNGFTTVYGHLSDGYGPIKTYIDSTHYKDQAFEIEMFPNAGDLPVKKGDVIAFSGNSGGSGGPHLHFEVRNTKSEKVINPLFFGFDQLIVDTKKPIINTLMVYPIGDSTSVNQSQRPLAVNVVLQADGNYIADKILAKGSIGFGISTYDGFDFTYNKNGPFKVATLSNGTKFFSYQFDTFGFDEGRYINALLDYRRFKKTGMRIQKLFLSPSFPLSIINSGFENGIIEVSPNLNRNFKIEVSDFNNNKVSIDIPIEYADLPVTAKKEPQRATNYFLKAKNDNNYKKGNVSVFVPANTFYEDFYLDFDVQKNVLTFAEDAIAVHSNFTITFEDTIASSIQKEKMFIASLDGKKLSYNATKRKGNMLTTYTKNLGQFTLAIDTIAPKITPLNIKVGKWLSKQTTLQLAISDNLSGINKFDGFLNGKWILFEFDYKTKKITHNFSDGIFVDGRNDLKVVVSDNVGNSTIFETHFFRKKQ